jgi:hypothetical protein
MPSLVLIVVVAVALLNILVSIGIIFSAAYATGQKVMQLCLVWLVPLLGAFIVWCFLRENYRIGVAASRSEGSLATPNYDFPPGDGGSEHGGTGGQ